MQDVGAVPLNSKKRIVNTLEEQEDMRQRTRKVLERFRRLRENLLPILQQVQDELGYLPCEAMMEVAKFLKIPEMDVYSVVTFYNQFRLIQPGKHSIRVCLGTACHMQGGYILLDAWKRRLGIGRGETTPDREFDLDTVACVGCCAMAPVNVIDKKALGRISPTRVDGILLAYKMAKEKEGKESQ